LIPRLLLLAALIALLAVILRVSDQGATLEDASGTRSEQTGYYLRDAVVTEFGQDGNIRLQLAARRATENVSEQTIALESVSVDYFALPGQRWNLTADAGSARPGLNTVELAGNVVMTGGKQSLPDPAVVRTERLTLDVRSQQAVTDAPVTLGLGPYSLASTGMRADLKAETLRLESGVNGHFQP
jgi:LPS export ABC transporter protein LptC